MIEVSCNGRVRVDGIPMRVESHGKRRRFKYKGRKVDVVALVRRVIHGPSGRPDWTNEQVFPRERPEFEMWFPVSEFLVDR